LAAAHRLRAQGASVVVLEKEARVGGKACTLQEDGFILEQGPLGFLDREPELRALAQSVGCALLEASPAVRDRRLVSKGRLVSHPSGPWSVLPSPLLSLPAKLRLLMEPWVRAGGTEKETVAEAGRRRLGKDAYKAFFAPFVGGIHAGDPESLSLKAAFPRLFDWERSHGSWIRGAKKSGTGPPKTYSFAAGMQSFAEALANDLGEEGVQLNAAPTQALRSDDSWALQNSSGEPIALGRHLHLAVSAQVAARMLGQVPELREVADSMDVAPIGVLHLAYRKEDVADRVKGYGFLVPREENSSILGVQFPSEVFPSQTPEGWVQIRVLLGGMAHPNCLAEEKETVVEWAKDGLHAWLGLDMEPERVWWKRWPYGIPQATVGTEERLAQFHQAAEHLGNLHFLGDAFRGIGVPAAFATD